MVYIHWRSATSKRFDPPPFLGNAQTYTVFLCLGLPLQIRIQCGRPSVPNVIVSHLYFTCVDSKFNFCAYLCLLCQKKLRQSALGCTLWLCPLFPLKQAHRPWGCAILKLCWLIKLSGSLSSWDCLEYSKYYREVQSHGNNDKKYCWKLMTAGNFLKIGHFFENEAIFENGANFENRAFFWK